MLTYRKLKLDEELMDDDNINLDENVQINFTNTLLEQTINNMIY